MNFIKISHELFLVICWSHLTPPVGKFTEFWNQHQYST